MDAWQRMQELIPDAPISPTWPARLYRPLVSALRKEQLSYEDTAAAYQRIELPLVKPITPRPHQRDALSAFRNNGFEGVVVLPTGAGKTICAVLAIAELGRSTLV